VQSVHLAVVRFDPATLHIMNLCLVYVQGVDLINDQTKRLVSLGIWINLLPVCVIYSCITLLCRLCFAYTDLAVFCVLVWVHNMFFNLRDN